jgi:hypothetical protein
MTDPIFTRDAGVSAFEDAEGVVSSADDGVSFSWDEEHVVRVDAPSDLEGAFDTDRFYKIAGATIARPIKQPYMVGDGVEWYKKPADELKQAAWSFDNAPYTVTHPDTGMVKDVDDIHGFWRGVHYDEDEDRLRGDLYVPTEDDEALAFIEENQDVSPGFYNRVYAEYDGDTGDLTDDNVDGFQVNIYGDHIAGVEQGRCSGEDGCGLNHDSQHVYNEGTVVSWQGGDARGKIVDSKTDGCFSDRIDGDHEICAGDEPVYLIEEDDGKTVAHKHGTLTVESNDTGTIVSVDASTSFHSMEDFTEEELIEMEDHERAYVINPPMMDYEEDGQFFAIAPDETGDDEPKYPINNCSDVDDAWHLRGHGDYSIEQSTLESRIKERARELDCEVPGGDMEESSDGACGCGSTNTTSNSTNMADDNGNDFDIPSLSVDALADKNDAVSELVEERDALREDVDEMEETLTEAFDQAEHFSVELEEDECPCEAVEDLVADLDAKATEVEDLRDELAEYREADIEDRLDTLEDLGAEREEWEETADEADDPLDVLDEEIERREEVLEAADTSVKTIDETTDGGEDEETADRTMSGTRSFGRGHGA